MKASQQPPEEPAQDGQPDRDDEQALPVQSKEDTDEAWGEKPEQDERDWFYRDRPPHWDE